MNDVAMFWVFVESDAVPEEWRARARPVLQVALLPDEVNALLGRRPASGARLDEIDEQLLRLLSTGLSGQQIAERVNLSSRTVQRRLKRLRRVFQVTTTIELVALAAARGLSAPTVLATRDGCPAP